MADGTTPIAPPAPTEAVTPGGINHLVINVRDIEESHRFWTEMLGFKEVGRSSRRNMRFYSGDHGGQMNHHDIALVENPNLPKPPEDWQMFDMPLAVNHIAITMSNREAWLRQLAWLRQNGVKFHRRVNHGMTHSLYIRDPNGYSVELLYELPRETWEGDINAALNHYVAVPTEGTKSLEDRVELARFGNSA
jgi:catechol 2,3-dioxygenase